MQPSIWQLLIVAALVLILFGRGKISEMMGDVGKGIKSFKSGLSEDDNKTAEAPKQIEKAESTGTKPTGTATKEDA